MEKMSILFFFLTAFVPSLNGANLNNRFSLKDPNHPSTPSPSLDRFNFIDIDLLQSAAKIIKGNFMISPGSIKSTLAMLLEGASGSCADELRGALRLPKDKDLFRQQLSNYLQTLQVQTPEITLRSANRIFLSEKLTPKNEYRNLLRNFYDSDVDLINFNNPFLAALAINSWVKNTTNNYIDYLVTEDNMDQDTVMILANALFFKGVWKTAFDPAETKTKCFQTPNGCRNVNMMEMQEELNFGSVDALDARVVEIPYQGDNYSMVIMLPNEKLAIELLIKDLNQVPMSKILNELQPTDVQLAMPKFTIEFQDNLVNVLRSVGIHKVFEAQTANFSAMLDERRKQEETPLLNNFFHKTFIQVDELGTVAAAVTGAMVIPLMGSSTTMMTVDHPFLFMIRDKKTGSILFQGRVDLPDEAQVQQPAPSYGGNVQNSNRFISEENQDNSQTYRRPVANIPIQQDTRSYPVRQYNNQQVQSQPQPQPQQRPVTIVSRPSYQNPINTQNSNRYTPNESATNAQTYVSSHTTYQQNQQHNYALYGKNTEFVSSSFIQTSSPRPVHIGSPVTYSPHYLSANTPHLTPPVVMNHQPSVGYVPYSNVDNRDFQRRGLPSNEVKQVARSVPPNINFYQKPMPRDHDGIVFFEKQ